MSLRDLYAV